MYITVGAGVILIIIVFVPDMIKGRKKKDEPAEETSENSEKSAE